VDKGQGTRSAIQRDDHEDRAAHHRFETLEWCARPMTMRLHGRLMSVVCKCDEVWSFCYTKAKRTSLSKEGQQSGRRVDMERDGR